MNKELLALIQPELSEDELRELCRAKKDELGFDIEKALFPVDPLLIHEPKISLEDAVYLVEQWASVLDSVRGSVRDSVRASVRASACGSVWDSVWASVRASASASVRASVRASASDSVRASVWSSAWDSVVAYVSSIFYGIDDWKYIDHEGGGNPFKPAIDLWEAGYIASYDGEIWRLHCGEDAKIVWEGSF